MDGGSLPGIAFASRDAEHATRLYKGFAEYWSVSAGGGETFKDLAWSYKTPLPDNVKIAGLVAFYNERSDFITDGERQARPKTKVS